MSHWDIGDPVQVRVSASTWCNATVTSYMGGGKYACMITETPLPTLAQIGKTHPRVPSSTPINAKVVVNEASNSFGEPSIRTPI